MNYYPFHIGDYAAHTAHLSLEEDIAYRRMLDWSYLNEKPLPLDVARLAKLIRMPKSFAVITNVLEEFFTQGEQGWSNKRVETELASMAAKQQEQSTKQAHESDRMRRHRERRAELFDALREVGVVPPWDVSMKDLQRLHDAHCNAPETDLKREQVVSAEKPATAIPIPTPIPVTPSLRSGVDRASPQRGSRLDPDWQLPDDWAQWAKAERPELDVAETAARFADYWHSVAGAKGKKLDWQATWRNWVRNERAPPTQPAGETAYQRSMRERVQEVAPAVARKTPGEYVNPTTIFENLAKASKTLEITQ